MPAKAGRGRHHRSVANAAPARHGRDRGRHSGSRRWPLAPALRSGLPIRARAGIRPGSPRAPSFVSAAAFAGVARDRPWLWALLVGLPTPILDIIRTGNTGSILALGFAAAGAAIGWAVRRAG